MPHEVHVVLHKPCPLVPVVVRGKATTDLLDYEFADVRAEGGCGAGEYLLQVLQQIHFNDKVFVGELVSATLAQALFYCICCTSAAINHC